ncbi:phosphatidate cytidylyltransferase [Hydrogenophaga sp. 5NK40-0174]|uniref:phosphatidate cytidylyltransferase n=1 Tax=Hydrogenophaga sp. 5NK40-0174 TaxID=3127649 RepID=UPI00310A36FC
MMSPETLSSFQATWPLFVGVIGVLLFASGIGAFLRWRVAGGGAHSVIDNLIDRVNAWWIMVLVLGTAFAMGRAGVVLLFFLISFYGLREFTSLLKTRRADHSAIAAAFYIALPAQYLFIYVDWYGMYSIFIPVWAFLIMPILSVSGSDTERFLERTSKVQWGLMITVFCISHVPALLNLKIPGFEGRNLLLIAFMVIVVQGSDVLQYVWGKLLGKRKLAPALSPSKTVEGLVGGVASATLLGAALAWATPFNVVEAALVAFALCLMGFFGGLVMSAIKRDRGVKDWGVMIEGHGGMLDRMDSVIFAAPVFFHLLHYRWSL